MKVLTIVTSYNRKESLTNLLKSLDKQETDIIIYDDCSDFQLDRPDYIKLSFNYGKEYLWLKFKKIFKEIPKTYDYYIILPDDISISDNFIKNSVDLWVKLPDKTKISLSLLTDLRVKSPNWTNFKPIIKDNYVQSEWNDLCFICEKEFFNIKIQAISLQRWQILAKSLNIELGSGLGGQISRYWHNLGRSQYHTKESLVKHGLCESEMNPIERKVNPL